MTHTEIVEEMERIGQLLLEAGLVVSEVYRKWEQTVCDAICSWNENVRVP